MQLGVEALVVGGDVEDAGALVLAVDIHRHERVERAVDLPELLLLVVVLVDARDVGAGHVVDGPVGDDDVRAGRRCVDVGGRGLGAPVAVAFVHVVEDDRRRHAVRHVDAVEDERDHGVGVVLGVFAQVDGYLAVRKGAAEPVGAGFGDVEDGDGRSLLGGVPLVRPALAVGVAAVVGVAVLVVDDVVGGVDPRSLAHRVLRGGGGLSVDEDPRVRQDDVDRSLLGVGRGRARRADRRFLRRGRGALRRQGERGGAGEQGEPQADDGDPVVEPDAVERRAVSPAVQGRSGLRAFDARACLRVFACIHERGLVHVHRSLPFCCRRRLGRVGLSVPRPCWGPGCAGALVVPGRRSRRGPSVEPRGGIVEALASTQCRRLTLDS